MFLFFCEFKKMENKKYDLEPFKFHEFERNFMNLNKIPRILQKVLEFGESLGC